MHFLDYPDKQINELGARGIGEIGLACIAAATYHAIGVRVRELPSTITSMSLQVRKAKDLLRRSDW